jgi:hypothetical protein
MLIWSRFTRLLDRMAHVPMFHPVYVDSRALGRMNAIHGRKAAHDQIDVHKLAVWPRGSMLPRACVYPAGTRATRSGSYACSDRRLWWTCAAPFPNLTHWRTVSIQPPYCIGR